MKRILTFFLLSFCAMGAQAQVVLLAIDSVFALPYQPSQNDSVRLYVYGHCNKYVEPESAPFIGNNGHEHTYSLCYLVNDALNTPTNIRDSATLFMASSPGTDTIIWMLFWNSNLQNFCDTSLASDTIFMQVLPSGIAVLDGRNPQISWDCGTSTLCVSGFSGTVEMSIYDLDGRKMFARRSQEQSARLPGMAPGIYVARAVDEKGNFRVEKIFVK